VGYEREVLESVGESQNSKKRNQVEEEGDVGPVHDSNLDCEY